MNICIYEIPKLQQFYRSPKKLAHIFIFSWKYFIISLNAIVGTENELLNTGYSKPMSDY